MKKLLVFLLIGLFHFCHRDYGYQNKPIVKEINLQGHRGARGLRPENTLPAFDLAMRYKMKTLELDTVLTADNNLIIHHDRKISADLCQNADGTAIASKAIREMSVADLRKLDCGSKENPRFPEQKLIPKTPLVTLGEFLDHVLKQETEMGYKPHFNIEVKMKPGIRPDEFKLIANQLASEVEKRNLTNRTTVQCFNIEFLPFVKKRQPRFKLAALFAPTRFQGLMMILGGGDAYRDRLLAASKRVGADIISPYYLAANPHLLHEAHKQNLQVIVWTVNETSTMRELLEAGIDGIITDYPDRMRRVFTEFKKSS